MFSAEQALERARLGLALAVRELELEAFSDTLITQAHLPIAHELAAAVQHAGHCQVVGLAGGQGTGKSTWARLLQVLLEQGFGLRTVVLSLDDYYLPRAERAQLAQQVHPLLVTRGVPGTHDVYTLSAHLKQLRSASDGDVVRLFRFSKAHDDRLPEIHSQRGPWDVILFEGWCVGARPQSPSELRDPINELERAEDPNGVFRHFVNQQLTTDYARLWTQLDRLIFLAPPAMSSVLVFRAEQERKLAKQQTFATAGLMDRTQLARFIAHFERVTRQMLTAAPAYADVVVRLDEQRRVHGIDTSR
jgi:D-glycerate 3-kinase